VQDRNWRCKRARVSSDVRRHRESNSVFACCSSCNLCVCPAWPGSGWAARLATGWTPPRRERNAEQQRTERARVRPLSDAARSPQPPIAGPPRFSAASASAPASPAGQVARPVNGVRVRVAEARNGRCGVLLHAHTLPVGLETRERANATSCASRTTTGRLSGRVAMRKSASPRRREARFPWHQQHARDHKEMLKNWQNEDGLG
jgi:hypothetical protein